MTIKFSEVKEHINDIKHNLEHALNELEEKISSARSEKKVPIYLTKCRIKSVESAYLKTKRKKITDLKEITDYGGIRVLCLFEHDIFAVHDYLLNLFTATKYHVNEINVFNMDDEVYIGKIKNIIKKYFPERDAKYRKKNSGYKSIHYIIKHDYVGTKYPIEIQLRTLLQDVWGELEHSLSYKKGSIHPHIKKSFSLLARDLETSDKLMTHLRDISEKEKHRQNISYEKTTPRNYLNYEEGLIPERFLKDDIQGFYEEYNNAIKSIDYKDLSSINDGLPVVKKAYESICKIISAAEMKNPKIAYWVEMEQGFQYFCEHLFDKALKVYEKILKDNDKNYCVYFRMGEILFIKGKIELALAAFDESEYLLSQYPEKDIVNFYWIKLRLALTYWTLGDEYIEIAVENIDQAEDIYNANEIVREGHKKSVLLNNLCWYYLSKYLKSKDNLKDGLKENEEEKAKLKDKENLDFEMALTRFIDLENCIEELEQSDGGKPSSNMYDTAAWFCFHAFLKTEDNTYKEKALKYCDLMKERANYSSNKLQSFEIQINHMLEINSILNSALLKTENF